MHVLAVPGLLACCLSAAAAEQKQPTAAPEVQEAPECSVCTRRHEAMARARKQMKSQKRLTPVLPAIDKSSKPPTQ